MNDIRRTLLWFVFAVSLVMLWDAWNRHNGHPSMFGAPPAGRAAATGAAPASGASATASTTAVPGVPAGAGQAAAPAAAAAATADSRQLPADPVSITTDVMQATFDPRGASLVRVELLQHRDMAGSQNHVVLLDQSAKRLYVAQSGLISAQAGQALPNHQSRMVPAPGARELASGQDELVLRFESDAVDGRKLIKTFRFKRGAYTIGVTHEVVNEGGGAVSPYLYLQLARDGNAPEGESSFYSTFTGPAIYSDAGKFQKIEFKDIDKGRAEHEKSADNGWMAIVQHYFAAAWLLPSPIQREFRTRKEGDNHYSVSMVTPLGEIAAGARKSVESTLYIGPQEENQLAALAPGLELVKDYGSLKVLAKPLFWLLDQLHGMFGNWGWAIVGLVVLLKIAFYWLNASAYKSMAKMKAVNPKVMELRERYKDNPQQMQQEMMRIYREEKVNPLGGCLPILVQMPFFIALYWVLLSSVEMRQAPWVGWITDLSAKDPWFILPTLMTLSSLFQVWLNPAPPDPVQAKMMWIMPLAFGVMFFFFPAGLVLYWLTNNILSIFQQWFINRRLGVTH